jgi:stage IV sporulation protein B
MFLMFFKKCKNMLWVFFLTLFIIPISPFAYSDYIIPGGENIGIQINSKGILVVGLYKVGDTYPGREAGLKLGDKIIAINNKNVNNISEMVNEINSTNNRGEILIKYERGSKLFTTSLKLIKNSENIYKTGLYVKDTVNGIGTLTYIDPQSRLFGALGHEIIEKATGQMVEVRSGKIFKSEVLNIARSSRGSPGEKNARFHSSILYGNVFKNTSSGIFGKYNDELPDKKLYKVAEPSEVKTGRASILTVVKDELVEEFDIEIIKINTNDNQRVKNILFNITDAKLLELTGGIVQGMSGSPILQDDMIVGAVTHVVVDDTAKGYGIFIKYMLEEAEN